MSEPTRADTDWVAGRSQCTTYERALARQVKADVEKRNDILSRIDFGFEDNDREDYVVVLSRQGGRLDVSFEARAVYTTAGKCRLLVGDAHLHVWQVARLALEEMFFDA